jgi:hypothetical protein
MKVEGNLASHSTAPRHPIQCPVELNTEPVLKDVLVIMCEHRLAGTMSESSLLYRACLKLFLHVLPHVTVFCERWDLRLKTYRARCTVVDVFVRDTFF